MKHIFFLLVSLLLSASCADSSSDASSSKANGTGVGQSGAQDFGRFRGVIEDGKLPATHILEQVGFFSEHKIDLPEADCGNNVCVHAMMGVKGNMINGNNCTIVLLGLNTPLDPTKFERPPLNLAIAVDTSGSMLGGPIGAVRSGLLRLSEELDVKDKVTLITYSDNAEVILESDATSDPERKLLKEAIGKLRADGSTNIYDGLRLALESVDSKRSQNRQNRVILLSDGVATTGLTSNERIVKLGRTYAESGIGITTIGIGKEFDISLMSRLAESGAGNFYFLEDIGAVEEVFSEEIKTFMVPLAEDIQIRFDTDRAYSFRAAYGTRSWKGDSNGASITIPALFMATRQSGNDIGPGEGRRGGGGMIVIEITPTSDESIIDDTPAGSQLGEFSMSYRKPGTQQRTEQIVKIVNSLKPGETPEGGEFKNDSVEKAFVALNIYAGLKMSVERANNGSVGAALTILDPLIENVQLWVSDNPDKDIESDLKTMRQLLVIMDDLAKSQGVGGQRIGAPADPWPRE